MPLIDDEPPSVLPRGMISERLPSAGSGSLRKFQL
jgi:hypothetical protein